MSAGALHSDHVNYLILRYLQESGHENAAVAFFRDWHRPRDHRDPETFPFAQEVGRYELISVIQEGLRHDEQTSRLTPGPRRFRWTLENAGNGILENGTAGSRPSSSGKRKSRAPAVRVSDDFPTPAPKRQRRSEGHEAVHVNGDREAMDVDPVSPAGEADEDGENGSPAVRSESEHVDPPARYDSVAIQTDVKAGPKTSTMYWKVDKPGAAILHSAWNPDSDPKNARTLMTVGESLCRFYDVPAASNGTIQVSHVDYPCLPTNFIVTAAAWHPSGRTATCAVDSIGESVNGEHTAVQKLIDHSRDFGSASYAVGPKMLKTSPPGIVLCLRYSPNGDYLLVGRTNLSRGLIQIWPTPKPDSDEYVLPREPLGWRIFERSILDASWVSDHSFLVCGQEGLSELIRIPTGSQPQKSLSSDSIHMQGLEGDARNILALQEAWDRVRYDQNLNLAIFVSTLSRKLLPKVLPADESVDDKDVDRVMTLPGNLSAVAFRPVRRSQADDTVVKGDLESNLLATTFQEGHCILYHLTRPQPGNPTCCKELVKLSLSEGPALALAWSPDGQHLAVAGIDIIQIWNHEAFAQQKTVGGSHEPVITWRPDPAAVKSQSNGHVNGDDQHELVEPSLSWSADGDSLAFAVDKQLAVLKFTPSLGPSRQNGVHHEDSTMS